LAHTCCRVQIAHWQWRALSSMQLSKDHHFVPEFLLNNWAKPNRSGQMVLRGHSWDARREKIKCKALGAKGFCYRKNLFTVNGLEPRSDAIELYFEQLDTFAALAVRRLLQPDAILSDLEKSDFIRLLLSLEARRPQSVENLRSSFFKTFTEDMNSDSDLQKFVAASGSSQTVTEAFQERYKVSLPDQGLELLINQSDNPVDGQKLMSCHWRVLRIRRSGRRLVLGDRPLIRVSSDDKGMLVWLLPLCPSMLWFATPHSNLLNWLTKAPQKKLVELCNIDSVRQCDKYVFSKKTHRGGWLQYQLRERSSPSSDIPLDSV
jgi:Protein of unknown function (DUF4238)